MKGNYHNNKLILVCCIFTLVLIKYNAQVYNVNDIRFSSVECNPACISKIILSHQASYEHKNNFVGNGNFFANELVFSFYNKKSTNGIGFLFNNTHVNNKIGFSYFGVSATSSIIILNSICLHIGITGKIFNLNASNGNFYSNYIFTNSLDKSKLSTFANANFSFLVTNLRERCFVSFGQLNSQLLFHNKNSNLFPHYYFFHIGDFANLFQLDAWNFSYSTILNDVTIRDKFTFCHFLNVLNKYPLTLMSVMRYGLKFGINEVNKLQINPIISLYKRTSKRKYIDCNFLMDISKKMNATNQILLNNIQLTINYNY